MKHTFRLAAVATGLALAAMAQSAHAQAKPGATSNAYVDVGYLASTYKNSTAPTYTVRPAGLRLVAGMDVHPNLSVEGLAAFGVKAGDGKNSSGAATEVKLTSVVGLYVKPKMDVSPELQLFGRLGFASTNHSDKIGTAAAKSKTDSGVSYGLGASYRISGNTSVGLDYMSYYDRKNTSINGVTVSVGYRF